jgi:hypothetical protein
MYHYHQLVYIYMKHPADEPEGEPSI